MIQRVRVRPAPLTLVASGSPTSFLRGPAEVGPRRRRHRWRPRPRGVFREGPREAPSASPVVPTPHLSPPARRRRPIPPPPSPAASRPTSPRSAIPGPRPRPAPPLPLDDPPLRASPSSPCASSDGPGRPGRLHCQSGRLASVGECEY